MQFQQPVTLVIDDKYHSTQLQTLYNYCNRVVPNSAPAYFLKYTRTILNEDGKPKSLMFDLIDIVDTNAPQNGSLMDLNAETAEMQKVRRVFISNQFFVQKFLQNDELCLNNRVYELSDVKLEKSSTSNEDGSARYFYSWTTKVITNKNTLYKLLNKWNERMVRFDNPICASYIFKYEVEEIEAPPAPVQKRAPYNTRK